MSNAFDRKNAQPRNSQSLSRKAPSLDTLHRQFDRQETDVDGAVRNLVRDRMAGIKTTARTALVEEMQEVTSQPDFFDFGEMFDTIEAPAIEVVDG